MLTSDFSRNEHADFQNHTFVSIFFLYIEAKSTSVSRKIKVDIVSIFHFSVSLDVINHLNETNIKNTIILCVNNATTYKSLYWQHLFF